ncbi:MULTISPECIES: hypothetical protein [Proteus]|uniref:hypothetical protein n=1 Tax=Proteus TaxID=583 RepID=UPI0013185AFE|nr:MULTISPECIES: hypothetical protein [Proteus]EKU0761725.1 hypothetical protein [Proteus mirabilis]EKX9204820.1 hypothetical protein [Proteus mirabilis]MCL9987244.1 hypothetical protein [Proteus mirabilis]MCT8237369.1 hypothetical protein [Proteus mirabilis]MDF7203790.1 hypothetical protein [Proteus mirabilis]
MTKQETKKLSQIIARLEKANEFFDDGRIQQGKDISVVVEKELRSLIKKQQRASQ